MKMKYTAALGEEYKALWDGMAITDKRKKDAYKFAKLILVNKVRYQRIEKRTGVPWHFVALIHYRESTLNFSKNLCNGQSLDQITTIVPKGRGPYETFEDSAYDALVTIKRYSAKLDWSFGPYVFRIEGYNGYGYHGKGIPSPYLWGGSNKQKRGKYIADHVYDPTHWDEQLGVLTILRALADLDPSIKFAGEKPELPPAQQPAPEPESDELEDAVPSPKAEDCETKPIIKSKTFWASVSGFFLSVWAVIETAASSPYFWAFLFVLLIFAYIVWERNGKPDIRGWFR